MISCVVFDFDDTLVWSEAYKRQAFFDIASKFENGIVKMQAIFQNPNRGDRFQIMQSFAKDMGKEELANELANQYTYLVENYIVSCLEVEGASDALKELKQQNLALYINSATPEESLQKTIKNRGWQDFFKGIYGGHNQKVENLVKIANQEKIKPWNMIMVGDGENDRDAAEKFNCLFIGLKQGFAKYQKSVKLVAKDMTEIIKLIAEADFERK